jgi:ribosomal protein L35
MANKKIKTKKTLLRRVKVTKGGKIVKKSIGMGHLKVKKSVTNKQRNSSVSEQENKGHRRIFRKLLNKHGKGIKHAKS